MKAKLFNEMLAGVVRRTKSAGFFAEEGLRASLVSGIPPRHCHVLLWFTSNTATLIVILHLQLYCAQTCWGGFTPFCSKQIYL